MFRVDPAWANLLEELEEIEEGPPMSENPEDPKDFISVGDWSVSALWEMNDYGRIIACGSISTYNLTAPQPGPSNLFQMISKRLLWKGFIVSDHLDWFPAFARDMGSWIADGQVVWREAVHEGIENAPRAFLGLFSGGNMGKMIVRLAADA